MALFRWNAAGSAWLLAGSLFYLVGIIVRDDGLQRAAERRAGRRRSGKRRSAALWARYLDDWVMWNHVRTVAGLAALASFIMALRQA